MQGTNQEQTTFFDLAFTQRGTTNRVLETIAELADFSQAEAALGATYSAIGRPGHRVAVLLRVMILQHLYGLSDPQAQEQLADRLSFQRFTGLRAEEPVPDETAICRFRLRMLEAGLHECLLEQLNDRLQSAGLILRRTTLVDATLVESSRHRPPVEQAAQGTAPDADASYARKRGKSHYGYKAHVSADGEHALIQRAKLTTAKVDDSHVFEELIPPGTRAAYADKAYETNARKVWLARQGIANGILKKGAHYVKLTEADHRRNARKERSRRHIERIFAHLKRWQGYHHVRYLGLAKNQLELTLKATAYNLKRWAHLVLAAA